jgi:universal stress protein E
MLGLGDAKQAAMTFDRIIVGVELTASGSQVEEASQVAARRALDIARRQQAEVVLLNAAHRAEHYADTGEGGFARHGGLSTESRATLADMLSTFRNSDVKAELEISDLPARHALIDAARRHDADLVVIGKRNASEFDFDDRKLGAVAFKLQRHCPTAVWAADANRPANLRRVLVAVDLVDPMTTQLLRAGKTVARCYDAELHVLHAAGQAWPLGGVEGAERRERRLSKLRRELDYIMQTAVPNDVPIAGIHVVAERPGAAIVIEARRIDADVVVLGTRTRGMIGDALVGHTAERVFGMLGRGLLTLPPGGAHW